MIEVSLICHFFLYFDLVKKKKQKKKKAKKKKEVATTMSAAHSFIYLLFRIMCGHVSVQFLPLPIPVLTLSSGVAYVRKSMLLEV